jgi:DNA sulfur modification protein DndD
LVSDAKHYEKYSEKAATLFTRAESAVKQATTNNTKKQALYKSLEIDIERLLNEQHKYRLLFDQSTEQIGKIEDNLAEVAKHVDNAEALETINSKIENLESKIRETESRIKEDFTTYMFDENWILLNFESIHHQFIQKIARLSSDKRTEQSEFDRQIGIKEGEAKARAEILNGLIPLPIGTPSKAHMEEMINEQFCKVCNRPAEEGSEAYEFMKKRLEEYLMSQTPEPQKSETSSRLFLTDNIENLVNLSRKFESNLSTLRGIESNIKDNFDFNEQRRLTLRELRESLEVSKKERADIVGSSTKGADKLADVFKNYNAWTADHKEYSRDSLRFESELKKIESELVSKRKEKDTIDIESANSFLLKARDIIRDIELIINDTKQQKFDEFINLLENKSNHYFTEINKGAFTGSITFMKAIKANRTSVKIELLQNGNRFRPNQALETSMHISVLFAISQLTQESRGNVYPLIFDAPTSSFGESKTGEFLNVISGTNNQIIILSYDFIGKDTSTDRLYIKPDFEKVKRDKAFWIRLERPFHKENLDTINTEVITL